MSVASAEVEESSRFGCANTIRIITSPIQQSLFLQFIESFQDRFFSIVLAEPDRPFIVDILFLIPQLARVGFVPT